MLEKKERYSERVGGGGGGDTEAAVFVQQLDPDVLLTITSCLLGNKKRQENP